MAYAAVISLKHTIQHLLHSSHISIVFSSREIIEFADKELTSLQEVLKRLDSSSSRISKNLKALDRQIRDAVYKIEDVLESHVSDQLLSQSVDVEEVRQEITSVMEAVKRMKEDYSEELDNPTLPDEEGEEDGAVSTRIDSAGNKSNIVGLCDDFNRVREKLIERKSYEFGVISFVGPAGTGRSLWAKHAFEESPVPFIFERRAWVSIGQRDQLKEILIAILSQVDRQGNYKLLISEGEEKLAEHLCTSLKGARYLIALDNVCDTEVWNSLRRAFPEEYNGSRVLMTTSLEEEALFANSFTIYPVPILNEEESWKFFCQRVFGEESCPPELEEAGKQIVEKCEGLHLEIATAALFLSKAEKTPEHWSKVAAEKENSVLKDAYDEISEVSRIMDDLQLDNSFRGGGEDDGCSRTYYDRILTDVLGLSYATQGIMFDYYPDLQSPTLRTVSLFGMAGIGKTTLAREIFNDPSISRRFDHRVWITLGPKYQSDRILVDVLAKIDPNIDKTHVKGDEMLVKHSGTILSGKRCLVVLDDVWNSEPRRYMFKSSPGITFEILQTTRLRDVTLSSRFDTTHEMRLLDKEESWCLLREKVFAEELCPSKLERSGKMIAENCEGLPLMIVAVASLLSEAEKTPEFWNEVAKKKNSVFKQANDKILDVLFPSYEYLPQYLKACFLYLGVFPQNFDIPTSKLFKLLKYEGILEPDPPLTFEVLATHHLYHLNSRSLLVNERKYIDVEFKTCRLHSVFWHLSTREARKNKFFHVLNSLADGLEEDMESQRRLCIQNNILFGIKDVHDSMASISTARSLLCTGPPHQYPVPICFGLRLLRILDALTIRLYEFPINVLNLVLLKYLAFTYDGKLHPSISKLRNLEYLIVHQHLCTKLYGDPSYLPMEIWDMQELKHLQVTGSNLPHPKGSALLPNLISLLGVGTHSCTKKVFERMPNLKKLGIQIELRPDAAEPLGCLNRISHLGRLESLKCVIVNPELKSEVVSPPAPLSMFASSLKKLSLSGIGYPWEYMRKIATLPNLEVLKLQCNAFRGPEWVMHKGEFERLMYLLLEDTNLVYWRADDDYRFQLLGRLFIRHCYKLKEIPLQSLFPTYDIKLVDCNPLVSKQVLDSELKAISPSVHSSWEAGES